MIEVTDCTIYPVKNPKEGSSLRAFCQITLNEEFVVKSIRIIDGQKGLFIGMPQNKGKDEAYHDIAFPITPEARARISDFILEKYTDGVTNAPPPGEENQAPAESSGDSGSEW